ncbi:hypothetical protein CCAN11_2380032 [Capnocytophaga canimorsus]|uniref:Uncharacterized protein n=1 Tax=Capnocytophaga canimorsus TaxID=28188 RepID=A0A0B7IPW0_9FLAO|nr:hypothetical protein CCAN11_2380032 [Capnocytophaga canimorsus]
MVNRNAKRKVFILKNMKTGEQKEYFITQVEKKFSFNKKGCLKSKQPFRGLLFKKHFIVETHKNQFCYKKM